MQTWIVAIAVILVLQTTSAYLSRLIPIASPALMAEFGWHESWIGYLSAANIIGALFVLFGCVGLIQRLGSVFALQLSLVLGAASLILFHVPSLAVALLASALIGISNGTANPAGADVLQRYTPDTRRNFVFSIKQAGVPLGGVVAGLTIPPLIETFGWRSALVIAAAGTLAATALMLPFRARIDGPRERVARSRMSLADLAVPLRSLTAAPGLLRVSIAGAVFSVAQSCWFTFAVTYLVIAHGLSLGVAGLVFAVMQAFGVAGRILMGWIADNVSSTATLACVAVASAAVTILFGLYRPDWPAVRFGVPRVVNVSSETVPGFFFPEREFLPDYAPVDEEHPIRPQDPYATSKHFGEQLMDAATRRSDLTGVSIPALLGAVGGRLRATSPRCATPTTRRPACGPTSTSTTSPMRCAWPPRARRPRARGRLHRLARQPRQPAARRAGPPPPRRRDRAARARPRGRAGDLDPQGARAARLRPEPLLARLPDRRGRAAPRGGGAARAGRDGRAARPGAHGLVEAAAIAAGPGPSSRRPSRCTPAAT